MNKNLESNNGFSVFNTSTFNVIRCRYSLQEVTWRRIHNAIAKAMSMFVYKKLPANLITGRIFLYWL